MSAAAKVVGDSTIRVPLILGEVLFDHFPNGTRVLGGAPFNVAWNLQGLGLQPRFVSAVGRDAEADEVRALMSAWGLDSTGLQTCVDRPTGRVQVTFDDAREPSYEIVQGCAYDFVRQPDWPVRADLYSVFYFGSLAFRSPQTRKTILALKATSGLATFVDINIRPPWFELDWLPELLEGVSWLKLNRDELARVTGNSCTSASEIAAAARELRGRYDCQACWITCGSAGAYGFDADDEMYFCEAPPPAVFVDAVGAGDAFAAVTILGIDRGWSPKRILRTAVTFASTVCGLEGAICQQPDFYRLEA